MKSLFALAGLVLAASAGSVALAQAPSGAPVNGGARPGPVAPTTTAATPATVTAAPTPPPAPVISPEQLEASKVLMKNMRFGETLKKVIDSQKEAMKRRIDQSAMMMPAGSATPADLAAYKSDMFDIYSKSMNVDAALDGMVKVYAGLFTVDELKGMADFYASPAGQALVDKTLSLQQKSNEVLQGLMQDAGPKMMARQKAFVDAHPAPKAPTPAVSVPGINGAPGQPAPKGPIVIGGGTAPSSAAPSAAAPSSAATPPPAK